MKKIYGSLILTLSLLAGCSSGESSSSQAGQSPPEDSGEVVTIEYWHVNNADWGGNAVKEIVANFNESQDQIVVKEAYQPGNYTGLLQNAQAAIGGGSPPDVVQIGYNYISYVDENVPYIPVQELAARDEEDPTFLTDHFMENILDLGQSSQGDYLAGLPYGLSNPILYLNADLISEAGSDPDTPPTTWDEVRELSEMVRDVTGEYGLYIQQPPDSWAQYALVRSNGGHFLGEENGKPVATLDTPEAIEAFKMMGDMVQEETALNMTWEEGIQAFTNGKVAMMMTTIGRRASIEEQSNFDLRSTVIPTFGEKERKVAAGGNALFSFSTDEKKQDAAWEFMKYLSSPEAMEIWVKGTGYLTPITGLAEDPDSLGPFFESNPLMQTASEQMQYTVPWVNFPGPNGLQAEQALLDARDQILNGANAEEVLKEANTRISQYIQ
jgi:multiple sugar transport system substrate-binding protein